METSVFSNRVLYQLTQPSNYVFSRFHCRCGSGRSTAFSKAVSFIYAVLQFFPGIVILYNWPEHRAACLLPAHIFRPQKFLALFSPNQ